MIYNANGGSIMLTEGGIMLMQFPSMHIIKHQKNNVVPICTVTITKLLNRGIFICL